MSFKHKNNKPWYYVINYLRMLIPWKFHQWRLQRKWRNLEAFDAPDVQSRVNYYNKLEHAANLPEKAIRISDLKIGKNCKVHFFDCMEHLRFFDKKLKAYFLFGDVTYVPDKPSIVKSRPIEGDCSNSIVMKLGKIRHFIFTKDRNTFESKKNLLIGRGKVHQPHRERFMKMYYQHPLCDIGNVKKGNDQRWQVPRLTIEEQLKYKFILCLEGNDVASNLKWVMSSNSLAVMPKPKYETWFMEGTLIPNYHYVLIKDDYSDLEERLNHYIEHTDEALQIIQNAHQFIEPFKNKKQEELISLLVLKKYFEKTGQL